MKLFDNLAKKAIEMGKDATDFNAIAQKHANATIFYLIVAGTIWYFFEAGWWVSIPIMLGAYSAFQSISATMVAIKLENLTQNSEANEPEFVQIVQEYGNILETAAPAPGSIADENQLPYPKQKIKNAIVEALRITDDPQLKEHLKVGYINLANWQEGVGELNQGLDLEDIDINQDAESLAKAVHKQLSGSHKWVEISQNEQKALRQELHELGL